MKLRDDPIQNINIDFLNKEISVQWLSGSQPVWHSMKFVNPSPGGLIAQALRRMVWENMEGAVK